jgi:ketosteroid isomerase-like protein
MSASAAAVVRRLFDRLEQAGVEPALELLAADALLIVPPEASAEPDTYEGHEGARRYFAGFDGVLDDVRFDLHDVEEISEHAVLAKMTLRGRGAATGIPVEQTLYLAVTVQEGLVARMTPGTDRRSALAGLERAAG